MGNPDRIAIWTNLWAWVTVICALKWWFKFGDFIMDKVHGSHNAGDFKFRLRMIVLWYLLLACIIVILPDRYEFFPLLVVLWSAFVWSGD